MKTLKASFAALFTIIALSSCGGGPTHEEVANDLMDTMEEFADAIASVKDEATADKAAAEIEKIAEKMKELKAKADKLGDPPADVEAKIKESMEERTKAMQTKMMGMMGTMLSKPELMEKLKPAMDKMEELMKDQ